MSQDMFGAEITATEAQAATSNPTAATKLWQKVIDITPQDGVFGPKTEAATKVWQTKKGMTADGVVGPKSWAAAGIPFKMPTIKAVGVRLPATKEAPTKGFANIVVANLLAIPKSVRLIGGLGIGGLIAYLVFRKKK